VAALFATYGNRVVFVDCRLQSEIIEASQKSGNIKNYFNKRFLDNGLDFQRIIYFDTPSSRLIGKKKRGLANLHAHCVLVRPLNTSNKQFRAILKIVFGKADLKGHQISIKNADWSKHYSLNGVRAFGPLGKILYCNKSMGATFNDLDLNQGKRSRKAPIWRLRYNRNAKRLARGIPSNFNAAAVLCDHKSTQGGEAAFNIWIQAEKHKRKLDARYSARRVEVVALKPKETLSGKRATVR
jgi:hypothetical protein